MAVKCARSWLGTSIVLTVSHLFVYNTYFLGVLWLDADDVCSLDLVFIKCICVWRMWFNDWIIK